MDRDAGILIVVAIIALGAYWALPKETIYQAVITVVVALIAAGWFSSKRKRRR